jgi:hypothetical protein
VIVTLTNIKHDQEEQGLHQAIRERAVPEIFNGLDGSVDWFSAVAKAAISA